MYGSADGLFWKGFYFPWATRDRAVQCSAVQCRDAWWVGMHFVCTYLRTTRFRDLWLSPLSSCDEWAMMRKTMSGFPDRIAEIGHIRSIESGAGPVTPAIRASLRDNKPMIYTRWPRRMTEFDKLRPYKVRPWGRGVARDLRQSNKRQAKISAGHLTLVSEPRVQTDSRGCDRVCVCRSLVGDRTVHEVIELRIRIPFVGPG
jgi:hypothetical protein